MGSESIEGIPIELFEQTYKAKKSLGQNFIQNQGLIEKVVSQIKTFNPKAIIEIGPGLGAFTKHLVNIAQTHTIEFDSTLSEYISKRYPQVEMHFGDVLQIDIESILQNLPENTHIFGALPYNISKPIIRKVLDLKEFSSASFIIQKEVADKYLSVAPDSSKLSLTAQLYAKVTKHFDISAANFKPKPKVTSTYISFEKLPVQLPHEQIKQLETLINQIFTSPRKTISNNLKPYYRNLPQTELLTYRAQAMDLEKLIQLNQELQKYK